MLKSRSVLKWLLILSVLSLISCPNPINRDVLLHVKDAVGPLIEISTPADGSFCAKAVVMTGTVTDTASEEGDAGEVSSLTYEILSSDISGDVPFDEEGAFSFTFNTMSLGSTFVVKLTAHDWNGNSGEASITLNIL